MRHIPDIVSLKINLDRLINIKSYNKQDSKFYTDEYNNLINYITAIERSSTEEKIDLNEIFIDVYHPESFSSPFIYTFMELKEEYLNGTYNSGIYNSLSKDISSRKYKTIHTLTSEFTVPQEIESNYYPDNYVKESKEFDFTYRDYGNQRFYFGGKLSVQTSQSVGKFNKYLYYGIFEDINKSRLLINILFRR
jgi:hypothetical protein